MADAMDIAQQREQTERERLINNARSHIAAPPRFTCEECEAPIPEERPLPSWALRYASPVRKSQSSNLNITGAFK